MFKWHFRLVYVVLFTHTFCLQTDSLLEQNKHFFEQVLARSEFNSIGTSRLCTLETRTEDAFTYIHSFCPNKSVFRKIKCSGNLAELAAISETSYNLITQTRKLIQYETPPKTNAKRNLFHSFLPTQSYQNGPIIHEYLQSMPLWLKVQSVHELKELVKYLQHKMEDRDVKPLQTKPLLFISIEEHPTFSELSREKHLEEEEMSFLKQYFSIVSEEHLIHVCHRFYHMMMEQLSKIESLNYPIAHGSLRENIIYGLENKYKNLGIKELIITALVAKMFNVMHSLEPKITGGIFNHIKKLIEKKEASSDSESSQKEPISRGGFHHRQTPDHQRRRRRSRPHLNQTDADAIVRSIQKRDLARREAARRNFHRRTSSQPHLHRSLDLSGRYPPSRKQRPDISDSTQND